MVSKVEDYERITGDDIIAMRQGDSGPVPRIRKYILNLSIRLTGNRDLAEDLTQDTLLKVLRRGDSYNPERNPVVWLNTVTRRIWLDELRNRKRRPVMQILDADHHQAGEDSQDYEQARKVREEINRGMQDNGLGYEELDMFTRGAAYSDIAYSREIPEGTVKSRLFKARNDLKERLLGKTSGYHYRE